MESSSFILSVNQIFIASHNNVRDKRIAPIENDVTAVASTVAPTDGPFNPENTFKADLLPIIAPTYVNGSTTVKSCLMYLEGLTLIHHNPKAKPEYVSGYLDSTFDKKGSGWEVVAVCGHNSTFDVTITPGEDTVSAFAGANPSVTIVGGKPIRFSFEIKMSINNASWWLDSFVLHTATIKLHDGTIVNVQPKVNMSMVGMREIGGFWDYSYACSQTQAAFTEASDNKDNLIGISLSGFQIQNNFQRDIKVVDKVGKFYGFSHNVNDCIPTFSIGSWMSIIVSLILGTILLGGFLMLNSVQTMDRFDDPKQKQIVINFKE
uniref:Ac45-VOA1_TM domain-containing protein n=1 Tax=Rhabditophanes sp. KR3021 TaxID=114890 RepID=A0AC35U3M3_9BILA